MAGIARKNPLENADAYIGDRKYGLDLLKNMEQYPRTVDLRVTGDDLPHPSNMVESSSQKLIM